MHDFSIFKETECGPRFRGFGFTFVPKSRVYSDCTLFQLFEFEL